MALCVTEGRATKKIETVVDFWEADGAVHQMAVWDSNKMVDLGAGRVMLNTSSSRI